MNKILEIKEIDFELLIVGDNTDEKLHNQYFFFPVLVKLDLEDFSVKKEIELEISEITIFVNNLERIYQGLKGSASRLENMDQDFSLLFDLDKAGKIEVSGVVYSGKLFKHKLEFEVLIDQSYLPSIIQDCHKFIGEKK